MRSRRALFETIFIALSCNVDQEAGGRDQSVTDQEVGLEGRRRPRGVDPPVSAPPVAWRPSIRPSRKGADTNATRASPYDTAIPAAPTTIGGSSHESLVQVDGREETV